MNKDNMFNVVLAGCLMVAMLFIGFTRGFVALRTVVMMVLIFVLPVYFILINLNFKKDSSLFYSFFISIGLFSYGVYFISFIFSSLKISLIVMAVILYIVGAVLYLVKKKKD